jgi:protein phosphatase
MAKVGFRTDVGKRRVNNEDALLVLPKGHLYAVADGVGGQNSGEIASRKAVVSLEAFLEANPTDSAENLEGKYRDNWFESYFLRCFQKINSDIIAIARLEPENAGMATTAVACYVDGLRLYAVNIGDSRAYIVRDGEISQLTEDHSYLNKLINSGMLTKSEALQHPQKNMITRALGVDDASEPDFFSYDMQERDRVLLCTDGLHGELSDEKICEIVTDGGDMNAICKRLVKAANDHGGGDNITVICVEI